MSSQFSLLQTRRFGPLFGTQFLGALNDNLFKNSLVVLLTFHVTQWTALKPEILSNLAAGIFILPFFLFSATAGQLADKYDKARLMRLVKQLEIGIVLVAGLGFWLHSLNLLLVSLFLFGLHSTFFGPLKYAILPQHLAEDELVGGNALIEAGTFVAILLGTLVGGLLAGLPDGSLWITAACLLTAVAGYLSSRRIPAAPAPEPELRLNPNPIGETWRNIGFAREDRTVFLSILGISWFWLYGALFLAQFPAYARFVLGGSESSVTLLLATFTLGIGIGSLLCERLSGKQVEIGLVPFGSIGLSLFGLDLAFASPVLPPAEALALPALLQSAGTVHVLVDLFAIGLFGGFFIVPLYALVQVRSSVAHRARIIAANNIMNALFMVVGALAAASLLGQGLSIPQLFAVAAVGNAAVALFIYGLVPEFLLRFVVWLLVHSIYQLEKKDMQRIPESGAALLLCRPQSRVDALAIAAASHRPIRFFVASPVFSRRPILAAPVFGSSQISLALEAGELVCLFGPEDVGQWLLDQPDVVGVLPPHPGPVLSLKLHGLADGPFTFDRCDWLQRLARLRPFRRVSVAVEEARKGHPGIW